MEIKEVILGCYIISIGLIAVGLTSNILPQLRTKTVLSRSMIGFMVGLLVMCGYDMTIYYCNYVIGILSNMEVLRIGNCIIAGTMCLWLILQSKIISRSALDGLDRSVRYYLTMYGILWLILTIALSVDKFYTMKWLLLSTDIVLIIAFAAVSVARIAYAAVAGERENVYYMTIITGLLIWNYLAYFWGETSVYWGNSDFIRAPLDLTIVIWLIINAVNVVYTYRNVFQPAFAGSEAAKRPPKADAGPPRDLQRRIDEVCQTYKLTPRERELIELIYRGKGNKEIAESLFLSESTVKTHIYNIFRKMDVNSRISVICLINEEDHR